MAAKVMITCSLVPGLGLGVKNQIFGASLAMTVSLALWVTLSTAKTAMIIYQNVFPFDGGNGNDELNGTL